MSGFNDHVPEDVEVDEHGVVYAKYAEGAVEEFDQLQVFIAHQASITHTDEENPDDRMVVLKFSNQNVGDLATGIGIPWGMMPGFIKLIYEGWLVFQQNHVEAEILEDEEK